MISTMGPTMSSISRRNFIYSTAAALSVPATLVTNAITSEAFASPTSLDPQIFAEMQREKVWSFFRSFYGDKDNVDVPGFLSHFANSPDDRYQDAVLNFNFKGYSDIASNFTFFLNTLGAKLGKGQFSKIFHVTGDMRYGAVAEYVDLKNT